MKTTLLVRSFRTRDVYASHPAFRREITNTMRTQVGPGIGSVLDRDVTDWKKKPTFKPVLEITAKAVVVSTLVQGGAAQVWHWLDEGVPEREIVPRRHRQPLRKLRSTGRKRRPTRAALRFVGPGGMIIYRNRVTAGAIEPRMYAKKAARTYNSQFRRHMENAMRRGVRAAQRG